MIDIRPATADDLPRIEQIYDAIHTAEEAGAAIVPCTFNGIAGVSLACLEKRLDAE